MWWLCDFLHAFLGCSFHYIGELCGFYFCLYNSLTHCCLPSQTSGSRARCSLLFHSPWGSITSSSLTLCAACCFCFSSSSSGFFLQCFTSCYYYPLYSKYSVFTVMNLKTIFIFSCFLLNSLGNMQPIYSSGLIICI